MLVEKSFDIGEVVLNYADGPDHGPPILLLHGFGEMWQSFVPIISTLSLRWHVYALDHRGHGKSGRTQGRYRLRDYMSDVQTFTKEIVKEPVIIFGHSMSGMVAFMVAASHPERVRGLIIGDTPVECIKIPEDVRIWFENVQRIAERGDSVWASYKSARESGASLLPYELGGDLGDPTFDLYNIKTWGLLDPDACTLWIEMGDDEDAFQSMFEGYDASIFSEIVCPVLYLQSGSELLDRSEERLENLKVIPDVVIAPFESLEHDLHLLKPEPVLRAITYFLESLR